LVIIGIDSNDSVETAKACLAKRGVNWVQATSTSTSDFVEKRLRIMHYPTLILLDPERRVLSIENGASSDDLSRRLDRILPTGRRAPL
jgi:hypothetical protein